MAAKRCVCASHDGSEEWHGLAKGYRYHKCVCDPCKTGHREAQRAWVESNKDHWTQYTVAYYLANKDKCNEQSRSWQLTHRDEENARRERYRLAHLEGDANKSRRRRARIRDNGVTPYCDSDIFERDGWVCQLCFESVDKELPRNSRFGATIDHLIPIVKGGPDSPENVQLAHFACNARKRDRILTNV